MTDAERIKELEARVAELEAALAEANEPQWFFGYDEEEGHHVTLEEAVADYLRYDDEPGWHFVHVCGARRTPPIWGVAFVALKGDRPYFTPCATEAEARALLKEGDQ